MNKGQIQKCINTKTPVAVSLGGWKERNDVPECVMAMPIAINVSIRKMRGYHYYYTNGGVSFSAEITGANVRGHLERVAKGAPDWVTESRYVLMPWSEYEPLWAAQVARKLQAKLDDDAKQTLCSSLHVTLGVGHRYGDDRFVMTTDEAKTVAAKLMHAGYIEALLITERKRLRDMIAHVQSFVDRHRDDGWAMTKVECADLINRAKVD
jgi:hypothetical protein